MDRRDPRELEAEPGRRFRAGEKEMHVSKGMEMRGAGWGESQ